MVRNDTPEPLSVFLERERDAGPGDHESLLEQAMALLEQAYVHLPAVQTDPIGQLASLRRQPPETRACFYQELLSIFARLGDRHTRCLLPEPYASAVAFLPFMVGEFVGHGEGHLVVLSSDTDALGRGDLLVSWNGVPVKKVIERHMAWQLGANPEARYAKALQTLTLRPLSLMPPPTGEVLLECTSPAGQTRTVRLDWRVAGASWLVQHLADRLPLMDGFRARTVKTSHGTFGHLRVFSMHGDAETFLEGFVRALESMPREGLILDMRSCEEGFVQIGERLLQLFTPRRIQPERFQFRVTELILRLVRSCAALSDWSEAVERAAAGGQVFSESLPLTSEEEANGLGQRYSGPVVLLTSALTYSTAEMFAAGFQDHHIGPVLGTAPRTGGGGASPWPQSTLFKLSRTEAFRPQPGAPSFRVAVRRGLRVHERAGVLLEGTGVVPDVLHAPTKGDLFNEDIELLEKAGSVLRQC